MPKIQEDSKSGRLHIVIPKEVAKLKGWKKGDNLDFIENMGQVALVKTR